MRFGVKISAFGLSHQLHKHCQILWHKSEGIDVFHLRIVLLQRGSSAIQKYHFVGVDVQ